MENGFNDGGKIAQLCCLDIPNHFPHAKLDAFVVCQIMYME
jgi:hypothetical protein